MKHTQLFRSVAALALVVAAAPVGALSQDTLSISGTFRPADSVGVIGADLAQVLANGHDHGWTLTLYGVTLSHDYSYYEWMTEWGPGYSELYMTRVSATSVDFEFVGPDADVLNEVVQPPGWAGLTSGAIVELYNSYYFDPVDYLGPGSNTGWSLRVNCTPESFTAFGSWYWPTFVFDENGFPDVYYPQRITADSTVISDFRPGNGGDLRGWAGAPVDIGSSVPPVLPPPPPPTLSIADGSVREENRGSTRLDLTVTLSRSISDSVTVKYATADGAAQKKSDYTATSGTLTISPGQTQATISLAIKGDRKRERDESFSVQLSNAVGATIDDGVATATILNDD
jgi:hypothetical protein